jgi:hypothetical protein
MFNFFPLHALLPLLEINTPTNGYKTHISFIHSISFPIPNYQHFLHLPLNNHNGGNIHSLSFFFQFPLSLFSSHKLIVYFLLQKKKNKGNGGNNNNNNSNNGGNEESNNGENKEDNNNNNNNTLILKVHMHCDACAAKITKYLDSIKGTKSGFSSFIAID